MDYRAKKNISWKIGFCFSGPGLLRRCLWRQRRHLINSHGIEEIFQTRVVRGQDQHTQIVRVSFWILCEFFLCNELTWQFLGTMLILLTIDVLFSIDGYCLCLFSEFEKVSEGKIFVELTHASGLYAWYSMSRTLFYNETAISVVNKYLPWSLPRSFAPRCSAVWWDTTKTTLVDYSRIKLNISGRRW